MKRYRERKPAVKHTAKSLAAAAAARVADVDPGSDSGEDNASDAGTVSKKRRAKDRAGIQEALNEIQALHEASLPAATRRQYVIPIQEWQNWCSQRGRKGPGWSAKTLRFDKYSLTTGVTGTTLILMTRQFLCTNG